MTLPTRRTERLRHGRVSIPGARYFLTLCTHGRAPVLTSSTTLPTALSALRSLHASGDSALLAATVMPDHVHLLIALGTRLTLSQTMAKFKTLARDRGRSAWRWQENGFEHRLRPAETIEDYGFYIFMNPYAAGVCPITTAWSGWVCPSPEHFRFLVHVGADGSPPPAWLGQVGPVAARLATGE